MMTEASSSRFPFCLCIKLDTGDTGEAEAQNMDRYSQKAPQEKSAISSERTRKDRILVNENNPSPTKHHKPKTSLALLLAAKVKLGSLYFTLLPGFNMVSQHPHQ